MRRLAVVLGLVLVLVAVGTSSYRWFHEPARYSRSQPNASSWRGISEPRNSGWRDNRSDRSGRGGSLAGLRLFEIVVDLLNIVVGVVGIWLAVVGVSMQRAANNQVRLRSDP